MTATIGILLATFNGAQFLQEQLDSIAAQSFEDWHLYARDDGSEDETGELLEDFALLHADRVTLLQDGDGRLGAAANFARLMATVKEPYIAFSDQDDVWHRTKLAVTLARLRILEADHGMHTPLMVHADRRLIDAEGREVTPSYWTSRRIRPHQFCYLESHYAFCFAAGSTMLINQPLSDLAQRVPRGARMHDCWVELVAHAFGCVGWLEHPVLDHRRHGANTSGARIESDAPEARTFLRRAWRLFSDIDRQKAVYQGYFRQAEAFRQAFGDSLIPAERARLEAFLAIPGQPVLQRLASLLQSGCAPPGVLRSLILVWLSAGTLGIRDIDDATPVRRAA